MITNTEWLKPKEKPYFHQISMDYLEKLVDCIGRFNKGEVSKTLFAIIPFEVRIICQLVICKYPLQQYYHLHRRCL